MIKKLRRKFILVAMFSVTCVLSVIIAAINIWNYCNISEYADGVLDILNENNGRFPISDGQTIPSEGNETAPSRPNPPRKEMNAEMPYETRYFTVRFVNSEAETNLRNIAAVTSEQAILLAKKAIESGKTRGYSGIYRFLVTQEGQAVLFVDCARQTHTAETFLQASLLFSGIGLIAVFILVFVFSKQVVKTIAAGYEKQKRFITDASHELKTPLTIISANNEITEFTVGQSQATHTISQQVEKMSAMIKNLTALARLDETDKLKERTEFSLTDALIDTAEQFRPIVENKNKSFTVICEQELTIRGDENLIRQALSALLENAAKYSLSEVELIAKKAGKNITIILSNDAENVPIGNLERCFERFYRTDEARASSISGNGVGLSVVKSIVELHGGKIAAVGLDGNVFRVTVSL